MPKRIRNHSVFCPRGYQWASWRETQCCRQRLLEQEQVRHQLAPYINTGAASQFGDTPRLATNHEAAERSASPAPSTMPTASTAAAVQTPPIPPAAPVRSWDVATER